MRVAWTAPRGIKPCVIKIACCAATITVAAPVRGGEPATSTAHVTNHVTPSSSPTAVTDPPAPVAAIPVLDIVGKKPLDPIEIQEAASVVDRISRNDIRQSGNLGRRLELSPSLYSRSYGGAGALQTAALRGAAASGTLVLIDGVPQRDVLAGDFNLATLPVADIDSVAVLRGGGSHFFGSSAIGGVISIDTIPDRDRNEVRIGGGSFDTAMMQVSLARVDKGWAAIHAERSSGNFRFQDRDNRVRRRQNNAAQSVQGQFGARIPMPGEHRLYARVYGSMVETDIPGPLSTPTPDAHQSDVDGRAVLDWQSNVRDWNLRIQGVVDGDRLMFYDDIFVARDSPSINRSLNWSGYGQADRSFDSGTKLMVNGERRLETVELRGRNEKRHLWALGTAVQQTLFDNYGIQGAVRLDGELNRDLQVLPSVGGWWWIVPDQLVARTEFHRSFRDPTFNELYWPSSALASGNPDARPESAWGYGGSLTSQWRWLSGTAAAYLERANDLLVWQPTNGVWTPDNLGAVRLHGIELDADSGYKPIVVGGAFSWNRAENGDPEVVRDVEVIRQRRDALDQAGTCPLASGSPQLIYRPLYRGSAWGGVEFETVRAVIGTRITGERPASVDNTTCMPSAATMWANLTVAPTLGWQIELNMDNLLDRRYEEISGFPAESRSIGGTVTAEF